MTRQSFTRWALGAVGLGAYAQQPETTTLRPEQTSSIRLSAEANSCKPAVFTAGAPDPRFACPPHKPRPRNGECPHCGVMNNGLADLVLFRSDITPYTVVVRCTHCSTAFWVDLKK